MHLLEIRASSEDLVDKILNGENIILAETRLNGTIVGKGNALFIDLAVSTLVDQFTNRFQIRLAICDIRLDKTEHLLSCFCDLDEDAVVDLEKTEQLQNFTGFGCNFVDAGIQSVPAFKTRQTGGSPADTDNKVYFRLSGDVEITRCSCGALKADLFLLFRQVLFYISLSALEDDLSLCLGGL